MKHPKLTLLVLLAAGALAATQVACRDKSQEKATPTPQEKLRLKGYFKTRPWTKGTHKAALKMALAGATIPLAQYSFTASKDGQSYSGVVVGTSPFATPLTGTTINAVVVPLIAPLGLAFGIHPVHLGVIFIANLELGYLMPPVGLNLYLASYRFEKPILQTYRAVLPMLLVLLGGVLLITYLPVLTTAFLGGGG